MDQSQPSSWRARFENRGSSSVSGNGQSERVNPASPPPGSAYNDGFAPSSPMAPPTPREIADEAAISLAADPAEYRPWILQRGRTRPAIMLHLRRLDIRSGLWTGWAASYPHLAAVEYVGSSLITLDFGTRYFAIEGRDLSELIDHLQAGVVLCVQEFSPHVWPITTAGPSVTAIRSLKAEDDA